ncbi:hypothetical protein [Lacticaseibacillus hulanensis]|jgi:hypothetical protein|uniref:hypothetical protein n=1 Tax=Lacticaseibacillus hulanensis TaxID=2493111 RepID=UPI000FDBDD7A|nr:hypothetical protein [Lacticaseibacillus hulanensis]
MNTAKKTWLGFFYKFALPIYWLVFAAVTTVFFKLHFIQLKYTDDPMYNAKWDVHKYGLTRLVGNELQIKDPIMLGVLILGVVIGIIVLFQRHTNMLVRLASLIVVIGAAIPLIPPFDENILMRVFAAIALITFGAAMQSLLIFTHTLEPL